MNNVEMVRAVLANMPAAEREVLAREVKEALSTIDDMLKPKRSGKYIELETPCHLSEAGMEAALSKMPPSTRYTLHVEPDGVEEIRDFIEAHSERAVNRDYMPQLRVESDALPGEWWIYNHLTGQAYGSYVG